MALHVLKQDVGLVVVSAEEEDGLCAGYGRGLFDACSKWNKMW